MRAFAVSVLLFCAPAFAQEYPVKPITAVIPFSTGSASDVIARPARAHGDGDGAALAVAGKQRLAALPDVPTAAEAGLKGFESAA